MSTTPPIPSLEEIVFENRNKEYGAFFLRKIYNQNVAKSFVITMSMVALAILIPCLVSKIIATPVEKVREVITLEKLPLPPIEEKKEILTPPAEKMAAPIQDMVKFTIPVITSEDISQSLEDMPTMTEIENSNAGTKTVQGTPGISTSDLNVVGDGEEGTVTNEIPFQTVEQMPKFGKGDEDLLNYIQKHTTFSKEAIDKGIEGKVMIRFVVGADGKVRDAQVLKSLGYGLDEEALKVIRMLPNFTPGKQNGRAVPVYLVVPFDFHLE